MRPVLKSSTEPASKYYPQEFFRAAGEGKFASPPSHQQHLNNTDSREDIMERQLAESIALRADTPESTLAVTAGQPGPRAGLVIHDGPSRIRDRVEAFIAEEYLDHFDAHLDEFMPRLLSLHDGAGRLKAAVGYRAAGTGRLFLEAYTNGPIEQVLREQSGIEVPREQIVEVGSLACTSGRWAMEIVRALVPALIEAGFSWVVFTGADTVRNVFRRLDLKPISLCIANKAVLGDARHKWGSYYDHAPVVMAGRIADGFSLLADAERAAR
jgi:Thermostable hemolysin